MGLIRGSIGNFVSDALGTSVGGIFGVAGSTASSAIGAGASIYGQERANRFARSEARRGREFAYDFRRTAYQDTVADMRAAGLNPLLAIQQGPNSGLSTAIASQGNPGAGLAEPIGQSARQVSKLGGELRRIRGEARTAEAEAKIREGYERALGKEYGNESALKTNQDYLVRAEIDRQAAQAVAHRAQEKQAVANTNYLNNEAALTALRNELLSYSVPSAKARHAFDSSEAGQGAAQVGRALELLSGGVLRGSGSVHRSTSSSTSDNTHRRGRMKK